MAKVKYFGILAENVDQAEEEVKVDSENLEELVAQLKEKYSLEARLITAFPLSSLFKLSVNRPPQK
jgi:molybdopterin converting factor small subunit